MELNREILTGGSMNQTEKIGDIVHKTSKGHPMVRSYLSYLEEAGMPGVPRFLGLDGQGRDMFTYIPGKTMGHDFDHHHPCLTSDDTVADTARFLRKLHDVSAGFLPQAEKNNWKNPFFPDQDYETICHGDTGIWNFVFVNDRIAGLIDFEQAYPGTRVWDLTQTLFCVIPLVPYGYEASKHAAERRRRINLFFDSYGMRRPANIAALIAQRIQLDCDDTVKRAQAGDEECRKMIADGHHMAHYNRVIAHLKECGHEWG